MGTLIAMPGFFCQASSSQLRGTATRSVAFFQARYRMITVT